MKIEVAIPVVEVLEQRGNITSYTILTIDGNKQLIEAILEKVKEIPEVEMR